MSISYAMRFIAYSGDTQRALLKLTTFLWQLEVSINGRC